jgi:fungal STAND N-terminal Goodbye domain
MTNLLCMSVLALLWSVHMTTVELSFSSASVDTTTDVGAIWREAIDRYEEITKVKIESLPRASNIDEVLRETQKRDSTFRGYRHDETKLDKFRTLMNESLSPIGKVGNMVASASSAVRKQPCLLIS